MKSLETYQKLLAFVVVRTENVSDFAFRAAFALGVFVTAAIIMGSSLLTDEIETFQQYSEIFYSFSTSMCNVLNLTLVLRKRKEIFQFIDRLENEIEKRMCTSTKCNRNIFNRGQN